MIKKSTILAVVMAALGLVGALRAAKQPKQNPAACCDGSACCDGGACCAVK